MYIDTSCLVAYYISESKTQMVQNRLKKADRVSISKLTDIELLSGLKKKKRMGGISADTSTKVYKLYQSHKKANLFNYILLKNKYFNAAETILRKTLNPLRSLDAIHLGITYSENLALFSFDKVMNQTAKEFSIPVV